MHAYTYVHVVSACLHVLLQAKRYKRIGKMEEAGGLAEDALRFNKLSIIIGVIWQIITWCIILILIVLALGLSLGLTIGRA